jgi:hypothetical protein
MPFHSFYSGVGCFGSLRFTAGRLTGYEFRSLALRRQYSIITGPGRMVPLKIRTDDDGMGCS